MGKANCFVCELVDVLELDEDDEDAEEPDVLFARAIANGAVVMGGRSMDLRTCRIHRAMIEDELEDTKREVRRVKRQTRESDGDRGSDKPRRGLLTRGEG